MGINQQHINHIVSGMIRDIWGNLPHNQPENITPEVVEIVEKAVREISVYSKRLLVADITFSVFYTGWPDLITLILGFGSQALANAAAEGKPLKTFTDWIGVMRSKKQYVACVNQAAANYRSQLEMALMGL